MNPDVQEIIEAAVGLTWADFKARHPNQAASVQDSVGDEPIVPGLIKVIEAGEDYEDLVAKTAAETNVARIAETVSPIVMNAIIAILGA